MRRNERPASLDNIPTVDFEGIGYVVTRNLEGVPDCSVYYSVRNEFGGRVVGDPAAWEKPASENTLESFTKLLPITD